MAGLLYIRTGNAGTDPDLLIADLGISVVTGVTWMLLTQSSAADANGNIGQFTAREIRDSKDLFTAVATGTLEWSKDGAAIEVAGSYTADYQIAEELSDDDINLTLGRLTAPNGVVTPLNADGREGEFFWKSGTNELFVHDGATWLLTASSAGINNDHSILSNLLADDHPQYLSLAGNAARNTITGKLDMSGGELKLPQAINVAATFTTGSEGDLAWDIDNDTLYAHNGSVWFALAPASGIITNHSGLTGLLADDHTQYSLLTGNAARNVVSGAFDFSTGVLVAPVAVATPVGSTDGEIAVVGGLLSTYDANRTKWLSADRKLLTASKEENAEDVYLRIEGEIASSQTGYRALRNGTITGMFAQTDVAGTWTLEIRKNGVVTSIASMIITGATGGQTIVTNVDFTQGDELQFFANTAGSTIESPVVGIEIAWRV